MKIGVTGCAGFLGSHLVDRLLAKGHHVIGIDNLSMGTIENVQHNLDNPNFKFFKIDVRNLDLLKQHLSKSDVIVHLAAYKIPRYGNALQTLLVNSQGIYNVLETAKENRYKVVLASTSDVYGKNPNLPFNEDDDLVMGPSTVARWSYAVSKIYAEHLCFSYQEEYKFPIVILRIFGSYGPRQHLSWWGGPQSVFISQILNNKEVTIHGDGKQTRTFTYVSDTIDGIVAAIENDKANGHIFNIGSTYEISIIDLAKLICQLCNMILDTTYELKLKFIPYSSLSGKKYEDVRRRVPNITKAKELLDFEAKVSLQEGLIITIKWQKEVMGIIKKAIENLVKG